MKNNIGKKFCSIPWTEPYISARGTYGLCGIEDESYNKNKILFREIFMMLSNHKYYNIIYIALNSLKRYVLVVYNGKNY